MKFKIGDKVVPISKSTGVTLMESKVWNRAKRSSSKYMYVKYLDRELDIILCGAKGDYAGDYFLEKDLVLYSGLEGVEL